MKFEQNLAGNFLSMNLPEAEALAEALSKAVQEAKTAAAGKGSGFVLPATYTLTSSRHSSNAAITNSSSKIHVHVECGYCATRSEQ